ncbi:MAG: DUF4337 domain-containing protein [Verrucomicrobiales bacterium]|nr:DUF4337 domain-containing protein [Verrucomicrobiales bacterium]
MADNQQNETKDADSGDVIERWVGALVVVLATFLGVCNVKGGNLGQAMELRLTEKNDNWAWYQARKIRADVYRSTGDQLSVPYPGETAEAKALREKLSSVYRERAAEQLNDMKEQMAAAREAEKAYEKLNVVDDQLDVSEAALAIGLALMGVTALIKRWWMFWIAMVPSGFGLFMGSAGFAGYDTSSEAIGWFVDILS